MNEINIKSTIGSVIINLSGNMLIPEITETVPGIKNMQATIPAEVQFNSSWRVSHLCGTCNNEISFGENYSSDSYSASYKIISKLDTQHVRLSFLENIIALFNNLEAGAVNGVFYINRKDFVYEFDMQRMTSESPVFYTCPSCKAEYLAMVRVGLPLYPEKNLPLGKLGSLQIAQIIQIENDSGITFMDLLEDAKIQH